LRPAGAAEFSVVLNIHEAFHLSAFHAPWAERLPA
jgi:hypothetical protein